MSESSFRCKICGLEVQEIPPNAIKIGKAMGSVSMYLIDGIPHNFVSTKAGIKKKSKGALNAKEQV